MNAWDALKVLNIDALCDTSGGMIHSHKKSALINEAISLLQEVVRLVTLAALSKRTESDFFSPQPNQEKMLKHTRTGILN